MYTSKVGSTSGTANQTTPQQTANGQMQGHNVAPVNSCSKKTLQVLASLTFTVVGGAMMWSQRVTYPCEHSSIDGSHLTCIGVADGKPIYDIGFYIMCIGLGALGYTCSP